MKATKTKASTQGVCHWCGIDIPITTPYRGDDPAMPPMVGWFVCTPACPERPDGATVYTHPTWKERK